MNFKLFRQLTNLSRFNKNLILILVDSLTLILVILASFTLRLGDWYWPGNDLLWVFLGAPILAIPIFIRFGMYHTIIRFIGFNALWEIIQAVTLYALLWGFICFLAAVEGIPRSVVLINWLFSIIAIAGLRMIARWLIFEVLNKGLGKRENVIIYGAGAAGRQLAVAFLHSKEFNPIGFLDDDSKLLGQSIHGLKVSKPDDLELLIRKWNVSEILLAMPLLMRQRRNEIINYLEPFPVHVRSLPSLEGLAQGKVQIDDLREVSIKDILGRNYIATNRVY